MKTNIYGYWLINNDACLAGSVETSDLVSCTTLLKTSVSVPFLTHMLLSMPVSKDRGKPFVRTDMPLTERRDSSHKRHRDKQSHKTAFKQARI